MSTISMLTDAEKSQIDSSYDSHWWDLDEIPTIDESNSRFEYKRFYTESTSANTVFNANREIRFNVNEISQYLVPSKAFLDIKVTITKNAAADYTTFLNPAGHVLFEKARYEIGTSVIEDINDHYQFSALVRGIIGHSRNWMETAGYDQGWALDGCAPAGSIMINPNVDSAQVYTFRNTWSIGSTGPEVVPKAYANDNTGTFVSTFGNYGFFKRYMKGFPRNGKRVFPADAGTAGVPAEDAGGNLRGLEQTEETYNFKVPLADVFAFCRDVKKVFFGFQHRISLWKNSKVHNMIHAANTARAITDITLNHIHLYMPYVKPSVNMDTKMLSYLAENKMRPLIFYPTNIHTETITVPANTTYTFDWQVKSIAHRPMHIYFFMTHNATTQDGISPTTFMHNFIKNLQISIGTDKFPYDRIEMDVAQEQAVLPYQMYLDCCGIDDNKSAPALSYEEWCRYYPVFCFDLSTVEETIFIGNKTLAIHAYFETPANAAPFQSNDGNGAATNSSRPNVQSLNAYAAIVYQKVGTLQTGNEGIKFISK